jgi:hypothetical protein
VVLRTARWLIVILALALLLPGGAGVPTASAKVNPLELIERQIHKINMLVFLDTSGSMKQLPGEPDLDSQEAGMDCDNGDSFCRIGGHAGRCFYSSGGRMGAGINDDPTSCTTDAQCRVGYCKDGAPRGCRGDDDCPNGIVCKGVCSNDSNKTCSGDSQCGSGKCWGACNQTAKSCTSHADCDDKPCAVYPNDFCSKGPPEMVKMCQQSQRRCRTDADCTTYPGDKCGPPSSRLVVAKRVLRSVIAGYQHMVNFGFTTFTDGGYFPYYKATAATSTTLTTSFFSRDLLASIGCFDPATGPAATCTVANGTYTLKAANNSRYDVNLGAGNFAQVDQPWCGTLQCLVSTGQGTGQYAGSYYTRPIETGPYDISAKKVLPEYVGKTTTVSGVKYVHWDPPNPYELVDGIYGNRADPVYVPHKDSYCPNGCGTGCGALWRDTQVPFMDLTDDPAKAKASTLAILETLEKSRFGGIVAGGGTPTGCAIYNSGSADPRHSLYHYMKEAKDKDVLPCRGNYVLLITDGQPSSRAAEYGCDDPKCALADPSGCPCASVKAAYKLAKELNTKVYVVGFSQAVATAYPRTTLHNIAKAGGTGAALFAVNERELHQSIVQAIYDAVAGSYSTAPATASATRAEGKDVKLGTLVLDSRVDFPSWRGQLTAYDVSGAEPVIKWNAATVSFDATTDSDFWMKRNVWTWDGTDMVKIEVDPATRTVKDLARLTKLGLGANDTESDRVARWMLGDPTMGNPAVLGAIINSTPIDVGPPAPSLATGSGLFAAARAGRPSLTYVGASDGMLHAFFTSDTTVSGRSYRGGQEAFAFIPPDMFARVRQLYTQGGQRPDPRDHVFGLASSPKVRDICVANCNSLNGTAEWRTVLVMGEGFGGHDLFVADITAPDGVSGIRSSANDPPIKVMWHSDFHSDKAVYQAALGQTVSVPALYHGKTSNQGDYRLTFASGYSDGTPGQGLSIMNVSLNTGQVLDTDLVTSVDASVAGACAQPYAMLTDVATARNFNAKEQRQLLASYFGDTSGNLWRYAPTVNGTTGETTTAGSLSKVDNFGCQHPLHLAPTVVQMDRDLPGSHPGEIYLVQATNSPYDKATKSFEASKLIIRKDVAASGVITPDTTFGVGGRVVLSAADKTQICADLVAPGAVCNRAMPATARPISTPTAVLRSDGSGFLLVTTWYEPDKNGCSKGNTYLTLHELSGSGVQQLKGQFLATEPVTGPVLVAGKLVFAVAGKVIELQGFFKEQIQAAAAPPASPPAPTGARFRVTSWTELP